MREPHEIIKNSRITEKATALAERENKYVFVVANDATKVEIAYAVNRIFKKNVESVNTMRVRGKIRRPNTKSAGRTSAWKKAIVKLKKGESIDLA